MSGSGTPQVFDFMATGTIEVFVVPTTGTYEITSFGAQGGAGSYGISPDAISTQGGLGGEAQADFALTQGETLDIAAGKAGQSVSAATSFSPSGLSPIVTGGMPGVVGAAEALWF